MKLTQDELFSIFHFKNIIQKYYACFKAQRIFVKRCFNHLIAQKFYNKAFALCRFPCTTIFKQLSSRFSRYSCLMSKYLLFSYVEIKMYKNCTSKDHNRYRKQLNFKFQANSIFFSINFSTLSMFFFYKNI